MKTNTKTLEFKFERTIPAPPSEVYAAWLSPKTPGTPWNIAEKFVLNAEVDGLFFWHMKGISHYGRFTEMEISTRIQHTWMSPNTLGVESKVTVTFKKQGENTLMTLVHSNIPDSEGGKSHEQGWNYFLGVFLEQFGNAARK